MIGNGTHTVIYLLNRSLANIFILLLSRALTHALSWPIQGRHTYLIVKSIKKIEQPCSYAKQAKKCQHYAYNSTSRSSNSKKPLKILELTNKRYSASTFRKSQVNSSRKHLGTLGDHYKLYVGYISYALNNSVQLIGNLKSTKCVTNQTVTAPKFHHLSHPNQISDDIKRKTALS